MSEGKNWMSSLRLWASEQRSSPAFIIAAICIGLFTDSITACSIIPVLPSALKTQAGVSEPNVQFYISMFMACFSITFLISCPIFGFLSDRLATKRLPFVCGMIAMICSLFLFMQARSVAAMVIARALQGVSSSVILVIGTALIKDSLPADMIGKGMAFTTAAIQLGLITGPAFGGLVYDNFGYEAVFIVPALLLAADVVLRLLIVERPVDRTKLLDAEAGSSNGSAGTTGETDPLIAASQAMDALHEPSASNTKEQPSMRARVLESAPILHFFINGRMMTALLVSIFDSIQWGAMESTLPYFVIRTFHWTPSNAGALLLIGCLPGVLLSYTMGKSIDRSGSLYPAAGGILVAAACHLSQRLVQGDGTRDKILLAAFFTTCNISMLFVQITMSVEIGIAAEQIDKSLGGRGGRLVGKAYALYMMAQSFGQLLGPIIGGAMIETTGWAGMTTLLGVLCLTALPGVLLCTGGGINARHSK